MLNSANNAGLSIHEFDIANETNVAGSTVSLRLFSDNKHTNTGNGNTWDVINYYLNLYVLGTNKLTWSIGEYQATVNQYDCGSVYGDSARILELSALTGAANGGGERGRGRMANWGIGH